MFHLMFEFTFFKRRECEIRNTSFKLKNYDNNCLVKITINNKET